MPYLLLGMLLVLGCTTGGVIAALQLGHRVEVLALSRPVAVGQELSVQDLREVTVSTDTGLAVVRSSARAEVAGTPVAYSLPAGTLLTRDLLGKARVPERGQAVTAVGLKAGQVPPDVQAGSSVTVVVTPASDSGSDTAPSASFWDATVTAVRNDTDQQTTVLSLQMAQSDARALAQAPTGQISVVLVHGGGQ